MSVPKQIIYPMRYVRPFFESGPSHGERFEERFRAFLGGNVHVTMLGRARAGLYLLAKMARREGCNRVLMLPHTIPDVVNMIIFAGCEPVFVDAVPGSTNVDIDHLVSLMDTSVCCVLLTHYHVNQDRMDDVREICRRRDIPLFDDCAIAFGGDYGGAALGTATDASVFSMSGFKALNYIWGGAVTTRNPRIAEILNREVEAYPRLRTDQYRRHLLAVLKYDMATRDMVFSRVVMPFFKRRIEKDDNCEDPVSFRRIESTSIDDSIRSRPSLGALNELGRKLDTVKANLSHRQLIAAIYDEKLADRVVSPETSAATRAGSCFMNYPVLVDPAKRERVFREMIRNGFHVGLAAYPNAHEAPAFRGIAGRSTNISQMVRSTITLPTHPKVTPGYAAALALAISRALG